jgi:hypothetical protein
MKFRWWVLIIVSSGLFCACTPAHQATGPDGTEIKTVPTIAAYELPCAEVRKRFLGDTLTVLYTSQDLYRRGAILPTVEGLACLDVLADWLNNKSQITWKVSVGGEAQTSFDAQALADKRQELLKRYFLRKGIDTAGWEWQSISKHRVQLRLDEL